MIEETKLRTVKFTTDDEIIKRLDKHKTRYAPRTRLIEMAVVQFLRKLDEKEQQLGGSSHNEL